MFELPGNVRTIIGCLNARGFEAYAVGGCVRDALLGLTPHDYDLAVNVPPGQTAAAFAGFRMRAFSSSWSVGYFWSL